MKSLPYKVASPNARNPLRSTLAWVALGAAVMCWFLATFAPSSTSAWSLLLLSTGVWALVEATERWAQAGALDDGASLVAQGVIVSGATLSIPVALGDPRIHIVAWLAVLTFAAGLHLIAPLVGTRERSEILAELRGDVRTMLTVAGLSTLVAATGTTLPFIYLGQLEFAHALAGATLCAAPVAMSIRQALRGHRLAAQEVETARSSERAVRSFPV